MAPKKNGKTQEKKSPKTAEKNIQNQILTWFIIFVAGFLAGIAFTVYKGRTLRDSTTSDGCAAGTE